MFGEGIHLSIQQSRAISEFESKKKWNSLQIVSGERNDGDGSSIVGVSRITTDTLTSPLIFHTNI